jgi:hypothetical protein
MNQSWNNRVCALDSSSGFATLRWLLGTNDFIYSPLDTPETASGGVILCLNYVS